MVFALLVVKLLPSDLEDEFDKVTAPLFTEIAFHLRMVLISTNCNVFELTCAGFRLPIRLLETAAKRPGW
jgi:hypothetical protein